MKYSIGVLCLLMGGRAVSQNLNGTVRDAHTHKPLVGVSVRVLPTALGTTTDAHGVFVLKNLPPGTYRLQFSSVGYRLADESVTLSETQTGTPAAPTDTLRIGLQPTIIQLNQQLVSTPGRSETADFSRPEITTVRTERELRQQPPRTVPEALLGVPGVWVQQTNHGGGSPFVRGLTGQQTLLLIDGIRLNNATFRSGPNQYLNTIDPQDVSRIEVVRSTGSVAYGSDAIGGVVNVLTRTPQFADRQRIGGSVYGKAMTQGMEYSGRAELNYQSAAVAVLGGVAYRKFGDLVGGRGIGVQTPTGYNQLSGDLKVRFRLTNRYVITAAYQALRQDSVPIYHKVKLEKYAYNQFNPQKRQLTYLRAEGFLGRKFLQTLQLTASWQQQSEGRQSQKIGSPIAVYEHDNTHTAGLSLLTTAEPLPGWMMENGVETYADLVRSNRHDVNLNTTAVTPKRGLYPDPARMYSLAVFSMHTLTLNRLTLTGGARYNAYRIQVSDAALGEAAIRPSAVVGSMGASVAVWPALRLVGSVQSAFRAPNIDDLGTLGIVDFRYEIPNPNLRPERSFNKELGLKLRTQRLSATLLAYHNRLTDFISRVRMGTDSIQGYPVYLKQNSAVSFIRGVEAEVEYEPAPHWLAYASATYTYGQNVSGKEPFRRIPPLNGRLGITWQPGNGWLRAEWLAAGAQTRLAKGDQDDNRIAKGGTPGWSVINLNGGYRWPYLTVSAQLQNLTNEAYRMHGSGVDGVGRSAWLSVLLSF